MNQTPNPTAKRLDEPVVLLFETSPFGTLDAIVQHDGRAVYFYLHESSQGEQRLFGSRACWVRNLDIGPYVLNEDEMRQGISPMLPRTHTRNRDSLPIPDADNLSIVWLEEGNGAALVESATASTPPTTLAVIPPWSGLEGFHGYAAECAMESPLCWPLPENPRLEQRIERAKHFWQQFDSKPDPFSTLQPQILEAYDRRFGIATQQGSPQVEHQPKREYFSIDGGKFPPRGMVSYQFSDEILLATVGVSLCPQPAVELFTDDPQNHRRIELAIRMSGDFGNSDGMQQIDQIRKQLSGLAGYPWRKFTWLGNGHTCAMTGVAPGCDQALLVHDSLLSNSKNQSAAPDSAALPNFRDDPINLLWVLPITASEQKRLQDSTLSIEALLASRPD